MIRRDFDLEEMKYFLNLVEQSTDDYLYILDFTNDRAIYSKTITKVFALEECEFSNATSKIMKVVHPDDVDMLMEEKEQELNDMQEQMLEKADKMDQLLSQAAKVLANNTNYATMVSAPVNNANKIKFIQLSNVDEEQLLAVIVLGGNVIKNKIITMDEQLSNENLLKLNMLLNTSLNGMSIEEINLGLIARLKEQAGIHSAVVSDVLDAVADAIQVDDGMHIYISGATNIFRYPELSDKQSAQEIISAFEEKQQLSELVTQTLAQEDNTGIQVYIGDETPVQTMKDCSVVTATYELGEGMKGTIGIIGPKRMDYEHVLKSLKKLQSELDAIFHKSE